MIVMKLKIRQNRKIRAALGLRLSNRFTRPISVGWCLRPNSNHDNALPGVIGRKYLAMTGS